MAIRELYYQNLQRLAYVFSPDPTYFMLDYFQENLNKEDFLKNSLYLVSKNLGSKAATEMLLLLKTFMRFSSGHGVLYLSSCVYIQIYL